MSAPCTERVPTRVICNPGSGGGAWNLEKLRAELGDRGFDWCLTQGPGDAREAASEWRSGLLVVAGGDGTVNEVVQGLGAAGFPDGVTLALLPTGTGNDLARTLAVPTNPEEALETVRAGRTRSLDAARIRSREVGERLFVNVAVGGAGAKVSEAADGEERRIRAVNVAVGNCRYAGGGWPAAPRANPEDGLLDLVAVEEASPSRLLAPAKEVLIGRDYLGSEGVYFAQGRSIRVEADPPGGFEFNVDGELIGCGPAQFSAVPRALKVIVGPGYVPDPFDNALPRSEHLLGLARRDNRKGP